uniref:COI1 F-box domain-containing protein n=1 Tax=Opuntia streptacantha TaxID=393608 RepID=A0A7C9AN25_OPUST
MKKHRTTMAKTPSSSSTFINLFDLLSEEIIFVILDCLHNTDDRKSFSIVCKSFYSIESKHRRTLHPLRSDHLPSLLKRYSQISRLDLTLCPRITDASPSAVVGRLEVRGSDEIKLLHRKGLAAVVAWCRNLVELDLSNATQIRDLAASAIAEAKNLERLP